MTPLETMYPNRCFDCSKPCPHDAVLCAECEALYKRHKQTHPGGSA